ncbi:hypothetical protein PT974_01374 [Cladobotryum mycophilum]|uniref:Zn(2)-C6 fungal-type domain-containing protein n=1 Tax=Cladobotryum mycophilum TaxID=491253 RepID=A0ABR0T446_9HYPO
MAEDRSRQDYPQQSRSEDTKSQPPSLYPRTSSRDGTQSTSSDSEAPPHTRTMATSVTLPSIHDTRSGSYGPPPPSAGRGYAGDQRYASPNTVNGYPPPTGSQPSQGTYLPPLQPQGDPRSSNYPPPDQRGPYYEERRAPPPHNYPDQYSSDYYYRAPQPAHPPGAYPHDYRAHPGYNQEYAQPGGDRPREAPRQRTSIACRYCRKRKIRCSGHQNAPGGKCQNCARMNQECIFQPVSSSSSTAFIPVSAVPGGVPPGTQLFGAYGQPLAPGTVPPPPPPPPHPYQPAGGPPPHHGSYYHQPVQSPTDSYSSYGDPRADEQVTGRRRRRTPEEREEGYRLPPPRTSGIPEEDPRRRSPAEFSNNSSPGSLSYPRYPEPTRNSPRNAAMPHPTAAGGGGGGDSRSPAVQNGSSGASTPARQAPPAAAAAAAGGATATTTATTTSTTSQGQGSSVMSLSNLVEKTDIDKTMIDRLNRPRDPPVAGQNGAQREGSR